jgi:putative MATE family efflux protein
MSDSAREVAVAVADDPVEESVPALIEPVEPQLSGRLAGLSLPRQVMVLALWPLLEQVMQFLVGTVDLALAGRLSPEATAVAATDALGVAGYLHWLMGMMLGAVGVGASALVARSIGAKHRRVANAALGQALVMAVGFGLLMGLVLFFAAPLLATVAGAKGEAVTLCVLYLRILSLAAPLMGVLFIGNACLRGAGDTVSPFWTMVVVNAVNIGVSVLLVFGPAPIGGHGVAGIAVGTVVAWAVGAVIVISVLLRGNGGIRLRLIRLRPHRHTLWRIVRVGVPNLLESAGMWIGNFAVLKLVSYTGGEGTIGSHMIAIRLESISFLPGFAVGIASATLVGQYLGAGSPMRARQAARLCWGLGAGIMGLLGAVFILVPDLLAMAISRAQVHQETVPPLLRICGFVQVFFATSIVLSSTLRGAGDTRWAMLLTYISTFAVRVPAAAVVVLVFKGDLWWVWIVLCGELVIRGTLFMSRFQHGGWAQARV